MSNPQKRAIEKYRALLSKRGMARFEVLGLKADRGLIRDLARRIAESDAEARRIRTLLTEAVAGGDGRKGGILAALRRSPLVGADIEVGRPSDPLRPVDL